VGEEITREEFYAWLEKSPVHFEFTVDVEEEWCKEVE